MSLSVYKLAGSSPLPMKLAPVQRNGCPVQAREILNSEDRRGLYRHRMLILLVLLAGVGLSALRHWGEWRVFAAVVLGQVWFGRGVYLYACGKDIIYWGGGFVGKDASTWCRMTMVLVGIVVYIALFFY